MRKMFIIAAMLVASAPLALCQEEALPFIRISRNPAVSALAGAGSASTTLGTAWAVFENPAATALASSSFDVSVAWQRWSPSGFPGNNLQAGVSGKLFGFLGLQAGFVTQLHKPIQMVNDGGGATTIAKPSETVFGAGLSFAFTDFLSLGANLRYAMEVLDANTRHGALNADIMLLGIWRDLHVTAGVMGLGQRIQDTKGYNYSLPASAHLGVSYLWAFAQDHSLEGALDGDYYFSRKFGVSAGVQYSFRELAFVRVGYRYASAGAVIPSHLGVGAGVRFHGVRLEASYLLLNSTLGNTFSIGLGYSF